MHSIDTADTVIADDHELVLSLSVAIVQSGPEPTGDWVWADLSTTVELDVLGNDHDPNEDLDVSSLRISVAPAAGTAVVARDAGGRCVVIFTAAATGGSDSFSYEVCDSLGSCSTAQITVMVGTAECTIVGTDGDDTLRGTPGDDVIRGIGDDDVIIGGLGDDDINAGDGEDLIWGGADADTLDGQGHDEVIGHTFGGPTYRKDPIAETPVGVSILVGPSETAEVMCSAPPTIDVPSPGYSKICVTDARGQLDVRYRVPPGAVSVLRSQTDVLFVWLDPNQDGVYDSGIAEGHHPDVNPEPNANTEPADTLRIPLAKAVNYVALGDSYSAGEAGDSLRDGAYQTGIGDADADCKRWDHAFPYVFNRDWLSNPEPTGSADDMFRTFACVGAITLNIRDYRLPSSFIDEGDIIGTDRPSHSAPAEPRQAVSLSGVRSDWLDDMRDVDLITVTIGGNDAGFADVLADCVVGGFDCDRGDLPDEYDEIPRRLSELLAELIEIAPRASIFVLGYPYVTPRPVEENRAAIERCGERGQPLHADGIRTNPIAGLWHLLNFGGESDVKISFSESQFLWSVATDLNNMLENAAKNAGVHFVDVSGGPTSSQPVLGFAGHSPCDDPPWINGFITRTHRLPPQADNSFHPNAAGHVAYARLLALYMKTLADSDVPFNDAGIPANPGSGG